MQLIAIIYHYGSMLFKKDFPHRLYLKRFLSFVAAGIVIGAAKPQA